MIDTKITEHKITETTTQVRQFLGLASYFRRFVKSFASIAAPLNDLLVGERTASKKKSVSVIDKWSPKCTKSFKCLRRN